MAVRAPSEGACQRAPALHALASRSSVASTAVEIALVSSVGVPNDGFAEAPAALTSRLYASVFKDASIDFALIFFTSPVLDKKRLQGDGQYIWLRPVRRRRRSPSERRADADEKATSKEHGFTNATRGPATPRLGADAAHESPPK